MGDCVTYTFNKGISLIFYFPLLIMILFSTIGLAGGGGWIYWIFLVLSLLMLVPLFMMSFGRRMMICGDKLVYRTMKERREMQYADVERVGIVRHRSYRFIYVSKDKDPEFLSAGGPPVPDDLNFIIQYRPEAFDLIVKQIQKVKPELEPDYGEA